MPSDGENLAHNVPCTASRHHYELIIIHLSKLGICLNRSVQQYAQPSHVNHPLYNPIPNG